MSDAPKEIWCSAGLYYEYKLGRLLSRQRKDWSEGAWSARPDLAAIKYVRADRIEELEAKLAKVKTSFRRNMIQAYPNYTYKQFAKDFDEMLKGDKP